MRISDWSSDVCSSDLNDYSKPADFLVTQNAQIEYAEVKSVQSATSFPFSNIERGQRSAALRQAMVGGAYNFYIFSYGLGRWFRMSAQFFSEAVAAGKASAKFKDRKSVVWGQSVSVSVDLGGRRIIKKKK